MTTENINPALQPLARPIEVLKEDPRNARRHDQRSVDAIAESLTLHGQQKPVVALKDGTVIAGNGTLQAARSLGWGRLAAVVFEDVSMARAYALADNRTAELSTWDPAALAADIDAAFGNMPEALETLWTEAEREAVAKALEPPKEKPAPFDGPSLADRFIVPPFSVLDARQGYWQERKDRWLALGIDSELGRDAAANVAKKGGEFLVDAYRGRSKDLDPKEIPRTATNGTSIFDPVLCELVYRWFCMPGGVVLDPFAGGSVRGLVAGILGLRYHGIELRAEQVAANETQRHLAPGADLTWVPGDSRVKLEHAPQADLVFSCPPYGDLEVYSDDAADLSNMTAAEFDAAHADVIKKACARLRDNRFAVWVIGDVRTKTGAYRGLVQSTVQAFKDAGLSLYNDAVLVTAVGSLPVRTGRTFGQSRKLGKTHQNVLVFLKGDARQAAADLGTVVAELPEDAPEENPQPAPAPSPPIRSVVREQWTVEPDNGHGAGDGSPGEDFPALGPEPLPAQERVLLFSDDAARWAAKFTATFGEFSAHPAEWMRALEDPAVAEVWATELAKAPPGPNHNGRAITVPAEYADRVGMALATGRSLMGDASATDAQVFQWLLTGGGQ